MHVRNDLNSIVRVATLILTLKSRSLPGVFKKLFRQFPGVYNKQVLNSGFLKTNSNPTNENERVKIA